MDRARIAHLVRFVTAAGLLGAVFALVSMIGLALAAQLVPMPATPGHAWGTLTGDVIRWMFVIQAVGVGGAMCACASVLAVLAPRVGYRMRDALFAFVPLLGQALLLKLLWRDAGASGAWMRARRDLPADEQLTFA